MSTIQMLFQEAELAEAAYAKFRDAAGNLLTNPNDIKAAVQDSQNRKQKGSETNGTTLRTPRYDAAVVAEGVAAGCVLVR